MAADSEETESSIPAGGACPLCGSGAVPYFCHDKRRRYYRCIQCDMISVSKEQQLPQADEKKRYDLHQNAPHDAGYVRFLSRLLDPLQKDLAPGSRGLDFGSGPEPVLSMLFQRAGHSMMLYDFFYAPDPSVFKQQYDFIVAAEVVEHLREPGRELARLWSCLKPGGRIGLMTRLLVQPNQFPQWHYKNDLTHICFYSRMTFLWLGNKWNAEVMFPDSDVVLFRKGLTPGEGPGAGVLLSGRGLYERAFHTLSGHTARCRE